MDMSIDPSLYSGEQMMAKLKNLSQADKGGKSQEELMKVARDFEAIFLNVLIKSMWKTIPKSGLSEESPGMNIYTDIMHSSLSDELSRAGGIGIAEALYEQMQKGIILKQSSEKEQ